MWVRRTIAGLFAWVGKVTLLFTLVVAGVDVAAHVLTRMQTGAWPETIVLGEPLRQTLQDLGIGLPSSSWVVLQDFLSFVLDLDDCISGRGERRPVADDLGRRLGAEHSARAAPSAGHARASTAPIA